MTYKNEEKQKLWKKKWYLKNKEKVKESRLKFKLEHPNYYKERLLKNPNYNKNRYKKDKKNIDKSTKKYRNSLYYNNGKSVYNYFCCQKYLRLKRDGFKCVNCNNDIEKLLVIHHINGREANHKLDNLVTLCRKCHGLVHSKFNSIEVEKVNLSIKNSIKDEDEKIEHEINDLRKLIMDCIKSECEVRQC